MSIVLIGLRLKNIALIDSLELDFQKGFTVLTGETGAGKSILLDAVDILFGGSQNTPSSKLLRRSANKAYIEGSFLIPKTVEEWLLRQEIDFDNGELIVSREWRFQEERWISRSRLNGVIVNRQQILNLRPLLIDLTFQGQAQNLSSSIYQRVCLDKLGAPLLKEPLLNTQDCWNKWNKAFQELEKEKKEYEHQKAIDNELQNLLHQLEEAQLHDPSEDQILEVEQNKLANRYRINESLGLVLSCLNQGNENIPSALDQFGVAIKELKSLCDLDSSLSSCLDDILDIRSNFEDLIIRLQDYSLSLDNNPERLNDLQLRLSFLKKLSRVNSLTLPELIARRDQLRATLMPDQLQKKLEKLELEEQAARIERDKNNANLTILRNQVAKEVQKSFLDCLRPLGLENVRFQISVSKAEPSEFGADEINFLFSANPGEALAPLYEFASGGEMSRLLLALKAVFAEVEGASTLFFDEIDAGMSGRVSQSIANALKELSIYRQVFCITHQPLIAASADHHFAVSKSVLNGLTRSKVKKLAGIKERERELAELVGGDLGKATQYAAGLLEQQAA